VKGRTSVRFDVTDLRKAVLLQWINLIVFRMPRETREIPRSHRETDVLVVRVRLLFMIHCAGHIISAGKVSDCDHITAVPAQWAG
jgi:hypothetical protein